MKQIITILTLFVMTSCFKMSTVLPEEKLREMSSTKVMELADEKYQANEYNEAMYYYEFARKTFTNEIDVVAWATYEVGFIKYQQGKYEEALKMFEETSRMNTINNAPVILALQMKERVQKKLKKQK
ncbi:MAG: hypothetical protein ACP5QT_00840 [Brevinematia bacterium]